MSTPDEAAARRFEAVSDLVGRALELPAAERAGFLDRACAGEPELRREVDSLLAEATEHAPAGVAGAADVTAVVGQAFGVLDSLTPAAPRPHPEEIGNFHVLELLGEGGMGTVYLGEQRHPVARRVALKLVHASLRSPTALMRFEAERNALARLAHPNVAQLFEAGTTDDGFPYFAMELIPGGEALTDYCNRNRLSLDARLGLFADVCRGVQHAHQKGILHRDIKPSNVLVAEVEGTPVPKIIDFGLAKTLDALPLTDKAHLTVGLVLGTPAYMSPEARAASPDLDTRTDVYSLGVLLSELVAGVRPHQGRSQTKTSRSPSARFGDLDATTRAVVAGERGLEASDLLQRIRGDLDWIVMTAVADDPERRYASAAELAADLERHLANEPIVARPPSAVYVAGRFLRRHWRGVLAGAVLVLALAGGYVGRTVEAHRADGEARRARQEAERAREALAAQRRMSDFLIELFEVADPERGEGPEVTARQLLDSVPERLHDELPDQPDLQARLLLAVGRVYINLGLYAEAEGVIRESLALRRSHLAADDPQIAESLSQLGVVLRRLERYDEALPPLERAVEILENAPQRDDVQLAQVYSHLGNLLWAMKRLDRAESMHRRALALRETLPGEETALAESLNNLGVAVRFQKRWQEARELFLRCAEVAEAALGPTHPRTTVCWFNLGYVERKLGHWDRAMELYRLTLERWGEAYGPAHPRTFQAYFVLSDNLQQLERWSEAVDLDRRWLAAAEASADTDTAELLTAQRHLGRALAGGGGFDAAARLLERAAARAESELGPDHPATVECRALLGWLAWRRGDPATAEPLQRQALARQLAVRDDDHFLTPRLLYDLARTVADRGNRQEAESLLRRALTDWESRGYDLGMADASFELGSLLRGSGDEAEADRLLRRALELYRAELPAGHPLRRRAAEALGVEPAPAAG